MLMPSMVLTGLVFFDLEVVLNVALNFIDHCTVVPCFEYVIDVYFRP